MTTGQRMLEEFDQEMAVTRRVLERVPSDKGAWQPHPKSFAMGHLAQLVSWMPGWLAQAIHHTELNLKGAGQYSLETTETLLDQFDKNVRVSRDALAAVPDAELERIWSLKYGDQVLMSMPRVAVLRQTINHLVHHRAQLAMYLRLNDLPVPSIYGPSADERGFLG
jgi:uncharacterized damage-inducible protein DinB